MRAVCDGAVRHTLSRDWCRYGIDLGFDHLSVNPLMASPPFVWSVGSFALSYATDCFAAAVAMAGNRTFSVMGVTPGAWTVRSILTWCGRCVLCRSFARGHCCMYVWLYASCRFQLSLGAAVLCGWTVAVLALRCRSPAVAAVTLPPLPLVRPPPTWQCQLGQTACYPSRR